MHAQQLPPGATMGPHPGLPSLPGMPPGISVPTSASAALLGLGMNPGAPATPGTPGGHPLSMLGKSDFHRQPDDLKSNGGMFFITRFTFFSKSYTERNPISYAD